MPDYVVGQRWMSDTEPELGLGHVLSLESRRITIQFPASGQTRTYATSSAPLTHVRFYPGDHIQSLHGWPMTVHDVDERQGLLTYIGTRDDGTAVELPETELAHHLQFNQPSDQLFAGQISDDTWFHLRCAALHHQQQLARSSVRGLVGARADLIPHQLYLADEISRRHQPRVLLADEVGLGKTIEAGLILHRLLLNEQVSRVLIIVPDALVHQWLVEMLRRFNLRFALLDVKGLQTELDLEPDSNPLEETPLLICGLDALTHAQDVSAWVLDGEWDLLIVDEAHHLQWSLEAVSPSYRFVERLSHLTPSLLLLTATPEQLGRAGHFARLRLLDPQRFHSFDAFLNEEAGYRQAALCADLLLDPDRVLTEAEIDQIAELFGDTPTNPIIDTLRTGISTPQDRDQLLNDLIDRHGTGRVLYRNTRAAVKGFPERRLICHALDSQDTNPILPWLITQLKALTPERVLLICHEAQTAMDLADALYHQHGFHPALFHEELSIMERDRAAAYFSDDESGTQLLICSEIGSEGRNFQFVHHLILVDLPANPDLLEQRIGRLDRIGQQHTVHIHVPVIDDSSEAIWRRWYHDGLDAFEHTCPVGTTILRALEAEYQRPLTTLLAQPDQIDAVIARTRELRIGALLELEQGRDRLLELHSFRPERAQAICAQIAATETDDTLRNFIERVFDCYGIRFEDHSPDCWIAEPSEHATLTQFPGLPETGCTLTTRRALALEREDTQFLTWDHPLARGALDVMLQSSDGRVALAALNMSPWPAGKILIEGFFRLDCPADAKLNAPRYLPPTLLRIVIDPNGEDRSAEYDEATLAHRVASVPLSAARQLVERNQPTIRQQIALAEAIAAQHAPQLREQSIVEMQTELGAEWQRLTALSKVNPSIRPDELTALQDDITELNDALSQSRLQMEALRVLFTYE